MSATAATSALPLPAQRPLNRAVITGSVMAASLMQSLDVTIAAIALPHIQGNLSGTQDQATWVLTSYIVASAISIPLAGWLAVRIGRKRVFLASVIGFTVVSALCGMAESLPLLVLFRTLQGISGAALVPLSQAILLDINPPEHHGRAMAVWGLGTVMGPIIGPLLGGWLTQDYSWRWVFYINVPFGIAAAVGLIAALPETRPRHSPFDLFGFATLSLGIGALQLMLDRGPLKDWFSSTEIGIEALLAAVGLYLFTIHTLSARQPFIGRALFTNRNFIIGNAFVFMFGAAVFAVIAVLPTLLQGPMGYPALTAGLVTAPRSVGTAVSMLVVGRLIGRIDARWLVTTGFLLNALALGQMAAFSPQMDAMPVIVSGMVQGFGAGLSYVAMTTVAFATLPEALRNEGAALFSLSRNIGSSIGISSIQAYITYGTSRAHARLTEYITPFSVAAADPQMRSQLHSTAGLLSLDAQVGMQASWISYIDAFWVLMLAALLIIPLILFVRGARGTADQPQVPLE